MLAAERQDSNYFLRRWLWLLWGEQLGSGRADAGKPVRNLMHLFRGANLVAPARVAPGEKAQCIRFTIHFGEVDDTFSFQANIIYF